jgi:hypothetical protein
MEDLKELNKKTRNNKEKHKKDFDKKIKNDFQAFDLESSVRDFPKWSERTEEDKRNIEK